jgi:hypothetical protein
MAKRYVPETWNKDTHVYKNPPISFTGPEPGCIHPYGHLPSLVGLLDKLWSQKLQRCIVWETNRYASKIVDDETVQIRGEINGHHQGLESSKLIFAICLFMGLKRLPSKRLYWSREEPLFHCPVISYMMTRDRYELITRCLHVANAPPHVKDTSSPTYEKLHKIRWMMEEVRDHFKAMWSPNQQLIVDEEMIMYKGKYCPIKQYMQCKLVRFGLKVWAVANALSKYLWNFKVYCGKTGNLYDDEEQDSSSDSGLPCSEEEHVPRSGKGEGRQAMGVVTNHLQELDDRGHIVTKDNFFTFVPLFIDLLERGTMALAYEREIGNMSQRLFLQKAIQKSKT